MADLIIGALIINIWEEMAWTGFFQRRAASRWGAVGGSLVTSVFFTGIHVPLALDGAHGAREVATNLLSSAGVAIGVRLLIARVDAWSGRSLLIVGILHSSFNATETVLNPTTSGCASSSPSRSASASWPSAEPPDPDNEYSIAESSIAAPCCWLVAADWIARAAVDGDVVVGHVGPRASDHRS